MVERYTVTLVICIVVMIMPVNVYAAQKALFILDNFTHWLDFSYQFDGMRASEGDRSTSSRSQLFEEGYGFNLDYALYNPHVLKGRLGAEVTFDQRSYSAPTTYHKNEIDLLYNINGLILDRSSFPSNFYFSRENNYIQEPFLPSYNLITANKGFSLSLNHKIVPLYFSYSDSSTETSGLVSERKQDTTSISLTVQNNLSNVSQTSLSISEIHGNNSFEGEGQDSVNRTTTLKVTNNLSFSRSQYYRNLYSMLQLDKMKFTNSIPQLNKMEFTDERKNLWWNEFLSWDFGKALRSQLDYQLIIRESEIGREESNRGHGGLHHKLFESLFTDLDGQVLSISQTNGTERGWSGSANLTYQKSLPQNSLLRANYQYQYYLVDRNLSTNISPIVDEAHSVSFGAPIYLGKPDVVLESIVVMNANPSVRPTPYVLDLDYSVRQVGQLAEIVILPGSAIKTGDNLLVSYDYRVNPKIKFDTVLQSIGADLWLFSNQFRLYGKMDIYDQDLISGEDGLVRLNNGHILRAGFEANLPPVAIQVYYDGYALDFDNHDSIEGRAQYTRTFARSSFTASIYDRYTVTRPNSYTGTTNDGNISINTGGAGGSYVRSLFSTAYMTLSAYYFNTHGDDISRNDLTCRFDFRWNYGKLQLFLYSQSNWRFDSGSSSNDQSVHLQLRRYF